LAVPIFKLSILENAYIRILVPPISGLLFYGAWAFWVNFDHGQVPAIKAALTQGGYSFTVTLSLALIVEWLFAHCKHWPFHLSFIAIIACSFLYITSWGVNYISGTPNILLTILPGATVSTVYTIVYIIGLNKLDKHNDDER